ncbi:MAG: CpXC domain-containing protein [Kiritimatiellae bacterium]|nr:CpXC domain-containing protein [Kiritimatiellia bacterium]MCO5067954.1 CpXC domain-containing protein [Kiritimatiellia bacterium]
MSQQSSYPIRCPKCAAEQTISLYDAINVAEDPLLRKQLLENKLNAVTCPDCGFLFRVDKNLVYSDAGRKLLIFLVPTPEEKYEQGEEQFISMLSELSGMLPDDMNAPSVHLVFSRVELVERIFLVEAGLDERLVEYIKYTLYTRNASQVDPARKALLFNATDSTPDHLCFVVQDVETRKLEAMLQYAREAYDGLVEMFSADGNSADLFELFPGPHISARALLLRELSESQEPESFDSDPEN